MKTVDVGKRDSLRPEYERSDFGPMSRGKYANREDNVCNVVLLDPEVAQAFPNAKAVNDALRALIHIARAATSGVSVPNDG